MVQIKSCKLIRYILYWESKNTPYELMTNDDGGTYVVKVHLYHSVTGCGPWIESSKCSIIQSIQRKYNTNKEGFPLYKTVKKTVSCLP